MIELVGLTLLLLGVFAVVALGLALLKVVLWIILLPLRLLFGVLLLPLLLLKTVVGGVVLFVLGPIIAIMLVGVAIVTAVAVLAPLLPILIVGFALWLVFRAAERPAVAR
jgi:hypothetical protein